MSFDWSDPEAALRAIGAGQPGGLPMPKIANASTVRSEAGKRSQSIFKNYHMLKAILERHEATIQKRWMKKTKDSRRKILLNAWGSKLPATHRPDFDAVRNKKPTQQHSYSAKRDAFLCPSVNEEDLTKPRALLLLLNARGRYPPAQFAAADGEAMHLGIVSTAIMPVFLNNHVMVFTGRNDAKRYGELVNWDDNPDAFEWMTTRRCPQPGDGLLILESQDKIMRFLVACAKEILHDISGPALSEAPLQTEPPSVSENETGFASLAVMAAEAPYRVPAKISFSRIESLLSARRDAAADHMWSLREDPAYFSDLMLEVKEHRQESLKDLKGQSHPLFRYGREDILWTRIIGNEVAGAFLQIEVYHELARQAAHLKTLHDAYADQLEPQNDLPKDFLVALLTFQHYLTQATKGPLGQLKVHFVASPPMRSIFARQPEDNPNQTRMGVMQRPGIILDKTEKDVLWLARTLWEDGNDLFLARMPNVVDEFQRLIDADPKAKSKITPFIANILSELAILCECLRQLDLFQPWANTFEEAMIDEKTEIQRGYSNTSAPWARIFNVLKGNEEIFAQYGSPADRRFYYPVEKRKTKENTEAMQKAEANLDTFWREVDEMLRVNASDLDGLAVRQLLSQRTLQRTVDWEEPSKDQTISKMPTTIKPLSEIYFDLEYRTAKTTLSNKTEVSEKAKVKTRGAATFKQVPGPLVVEAIDADPQPQFQVDQKASKVFKTLFYTPSLTGTPGDVPWTDFLHALLSVGFTAEKLYGSVWQSSPTKLDVERSIHFHEPHPSGKTPYRIARLHGRRLNRAYGWCSSMFTLADASQT